MFKRRAFHWAATALIGVTAVGNCSGIIFAADNAISTEPVAHLSPFSRSGPGEPPSPWRVVGLPNNPSKPLTQFDIAVVGGQSVLRIQTDHSYANLVHKLSPAFSGASAHLHWRWRLDQPLLRADLTHRLGDDSAVKVCAAFDLPIEKLGFVERNFLKAARAASHEHLPAATLCYVWDHRLPAGTVLHNAYTHRIRFIVLDSGEQRLGQWVTHTQDLAADFHRAFGEESAEMPPLLAILVGADSDNTADRSLAYVADISLAP